MFIVIIAIVLLGLVGALNQRTLDSLYEVGDLVYQLLRGPLDRVWAKTRFYRILFWVSMIGGLIGILVGLYLPFEFTKENIVTYSLVARILAAGGVVLLIIGIGVIQTVVNLLVYYLAGIAKLFEKTNEQFMKLEQDTKDIILGILRSLGIDVKNTPNDLGITLVFPTEDVLKKVGEFFKPPIVTLWMLAAFLFAAPTWYMFSWFLGMLIMLGFLKTADNAIAKKIASVFLMALGVIVILNGVFFNKDILRGWSPVFDTSISWLESKRDYGLTWLIWDIENTNIDKAYYAKVKSDAPLRGADKKIKQLEPGQDKILTAGTMVMVVDPKDQKEVFGNDTYFFVYLPNKYGEYNEDVGSGYVAARKLERVSGFVDPKDLSKATNQSQFVSQYSAWPWWYYVLLGVGVLVVLMVLSNTVLPAGRVGGLIRAVFILLALGLIFWGVKEWVNSGASLASLTPAVPFKVDKISDKEWNVSLPADMVLGSTGIPIKKNTRVTLQSTGQVSGSSSSSDGAYKFVGPDGWGYEPAFSRGRIGPLPSGSSFMALAYTVDKNDPRVDTGAWSMAGSSKSFVPSKDGMLYLTVNEKARDGGNYMANSWYADNKGGFNVKVIIE